MNPEFPGGMCSLTTGSISYWLSINAGTETQSPRVSNPGSCLYSAHPVLSRARLEAPDQLAKQPLGRAPTFKV